MACSPEYFHAFADLRSSTRAWRKLSHPIQNCHTQFKTVLPVVYLSFLCILELVLCMATLSKSMRQSHSLSCWFEFGSDFSRRRSGSSDCQPVPGDPSEKGRKWKFRNRKNRIRFFISKIVFFKKLFFPNMQFPHTFTTQQPPPKKSHISRRSRPHKSGIKPTIKYSKYIHPSFIVAKKY